MPCLVLVAEVSAGQAVIAIKDTNSLRLCPEHHLHKVCCVLGYLVTLVLERMIIIWCNLLNLTFKAKESRKSFWQRALESMLVCFSYSSHACSKQKPTLSTSIKYNPYICYMGSLVTARSSLWQLVHAIDRNCSDKHI